MLDHKGSKKWHGELSEGENNKLCEKETETNEKDFEVIKLLKNIPLCEQISSG